METLIYVALIQTTMEQANGHLNYPFVNVGDMWQRQLMQSFPSKTCPKVETYSL